MKNLFTAKDSDEAALLIEKYGFCSVKSKNQQKLISNIQFVIDDFKKLVNSPLEFRSKWQIDVDNDGDPDDGLIERNGGEHDHKFFFHYKDPKRIIPFMKYRLSDFAKWEMFFRRLEALHTSLMSSMHDFVVSFDQNHLKYKIIDRIRKQSKETRGVLRLLYYKPGLEELARDHYDQSLFTFHVADSHPGLVINKNYQDVYEPKDGNLLLFPGIKAKIVSNGRIKNVLHGVVNNDLPPNKSRWSIVFFYHCDVGMTSKGISNIAKAEAKKFSVH